jgi:hypothetical protein
MHLHVGSEDLSHRSTIVRRILCNPREGIDSSSAHIDTLIAQLINSSREPFSNLSFLVDDQLSPPNL